MSWAGEDPATPNGLAGSPLEQASSQQEQTFALEPSGDLTYDASEMDFEEADHPNRGINDVNRMFGQNATFVNDKAVLKDSLAVVVPPISRPWDYTPYTEPKIHVVKAEREVEGNLSYAVEFSDGETDQVSEINPTVSTTIRNFVVVSPLLTSCHVSKHHHRLSFRLTSWLELLLTSSVGHTRRAYIPRRWFVCPGSIPGTPKERVNIGIVSGVAVQKVTTE